MADRRTSLLEAAERVLTERGLSATVADITEAAGVAKGTFYLYFSTKEDVIRAVQARLWEDYLRSGNAAAERLATEGWWPTIDAFIEEVVDFDIAHRDWHRLVAQGWSEPTPLGEEGQEQELIELVTAAIELGIATGECHTEDPALTATLLYRAMQGTCHQLCQTEGPIDRERLVAALRELIHKALAPA